MAAKDRVGTCIAPTAVVAGGEAWMEMSTQRQFELYFAAERQQEAL